MFVFPLVTYECHAVFCVCMMCVFDCVCPLFWCREPGACVCVHVYARFLIPGKDTRAYGMQDKGLARVMARVCVYVCATWNVG